MKKRTMTTVFAMIPMLVSNANANTTKIGVISSTYLNIRYSPSTSGKLQLVLKKIIKYL